MPLGITGGYTLVRFLHKADDLRGAVFYPGETHEHSCLDHASPDRTRILKDGVHAARPVNPDPKTYDDALRHACGMVGIQNPEIVPAAGVQWYLFGAQ